MSHNQPQKRESKRKEDLQASYCRVIMLMDNLHEEAALGESPANRRDRDDLAARRHRLHDVSRPVGHRLQTEMRP